MPRARISFRQIGTIELRPPSWLIQGFFHDNSLVAIYGASSIGKTFVVLNAAGCVATGLPFLGRRVEKPGLVIYVAGEGYDGLRRRYGAWCKVNGVDPLAPPLLLSDSATELCESAAVDDLEMFIARATSQYGPLRLLVIDTWSRNLAGDDNMSHDAEAGIKSLARLCQPWRATGLIIAHEGHEKGRIRGSSALKGDLDQEIWARPCDKDVYVLSQTKGRDIRTWQQFYYRIADVDLGLDGADGQRFEAGIIEEVPAPSKSVVAQRAAQEHQEPIQQTNKDRALTILQLLQAGNNNSADGPIGPVKASDWAKRCKEEGISSSSFYEARAVLAENKLITLLGELVYRNPAANPP